jgi:N6-adenosine-specific RNA methylase IME4
VNAITPTVSEIKAVHKLVLNGFTLTPAGISRVDGSPSFEQWQALGESLRFMEGAVHWWIGDWLNHGEQKYGEAYAQAMEATGFEYDTVRHDKDVSSRIEIGRRRPNLSWSHHEEVAWLQPGQQDALLKEAEEKGLSQRDLRDRVRDVRKQSAIESAGPLPDGQYHLLLADPPWQYDFSETDCRKIENHYPTMTVEELCALTVPAAQDAVLFLWATAPKIREALDVVEAWGFEYKTHAIWDKEKIGMGYWFRGQHELIFVATKGQLSPPPANRLHSSVIRHGRGEHSAKPETAYAVIEDMFPHYGKRQRIELFRRGEARPGWSAWGNEAVGSA